MASRDTPASSRPPVEAIKKAILNFVKGLVNKKVYRAFEIILSPCCDIHLTATAVCDPEHPGNYIVTVISDKPLNLGSNGLAIINAGYGSTSIYPTEEGATTFVFHNVRGNVSDHDVTVQFYLVLNQSLYEGIGSLIFTGYGYPGIPIDFPSCK